MKKLKVIFFGTPDFSVPTLELLYNHPNIEIVKVISMPDRPAGRGQKLQSPPVVEFAKTHKLPLIQTENINKDEEAFLEFNNSECDLIIVLAFAQFLGSKVLNHPKLGCFNIHTSLLPKYRGAAPIQYALLNGDNTSGVSIQKMVKKMDAGDLVHSFELPLNNNETGGQLYTRLKFQAALSMNILIEDVLSDSLQYSPQDEKNVSFAPTLKKTDGLLNFSNSNYETIHNQIRALDPWPGTFCFLNKKRLKVFEIEKDLSKLQPGEINFESNAMLIGCVDSTIRLKRVQLEGKKACSDSELLNGLKNNLNEFVINP